MTAVEIPTPDPRTFDETSRPFAEAVASRYAIKRLIGQGGMGIVYLARDRRLDRLVAIRRSRLRSRPTRSSESVSFVRREWPEVSHIRTSCPSMARMRSTVTCSSSWDTWRVSLSRHAELTALRIRDAIADEGEQA